MQRFFERHQQRPARAHGAALLAVLTAFALTSCDNPATEPGEPVTVTLSTDAAEVALGETVTLNATVTGSSSGVTWQSSDPDVAQVSATGVVTGFGPGTATVTARSVQDASVSASATITVVFARCSVVQPIALGATVNGTLSTSDCLLFDGTYIDFWSFSLSSAMTVTLSLTSADFDTYLILLSGDRTELFGEDDDGGTGFNSLLTVSLSAGSYTAIANSFGPGEVGAYELSLMMGTPAVRTGEPETGNKTGDKSGATSPGKF